MEVGKVAKLGAIFAVGLGVGLYTAPKANAADLNKDAGLGDLEERVQELESTVARKGNKRVTLVISGEISKALLWTEGLGLAGNNKLRVIDNPNSTTRLTISGEAKTSRDVKVGFVVEMGFDETRGAGLAGPISAGLVDDIELRRSAVWLSTAVGKVTLGKTGIATDGITEIDISNTNVASRLMSAEPLWTYIGIGAFPLPIATGNLLNPTPFHDLRANVVRYDSPNMAGFAVSGSWGGGVTLTGDDLYDVAVRYAGEFSGIRVAAGAGYRVERYNTVNAPDQKTLSGSASVMHTGSGLFLTAGVAQQDSNPVFGDIQMFHIKAGIERNFFGIGASSLYGEYADHKLKTLNFDSTFYGLGAVQAVDALGADFFVSFRTYDLGGNLDANVGMAGVKLRW